MFNKEDALDTTFTKVVDIDSIELSRPHIVADLCAIEMLDAKPGSSMQDTGKTVTHGDLLRSRDIQVICKSSVTSRSSEQHSPRSLRASALERRMDKETSLSITSKELSASQSAREDVLLENNVLLSTTVHGTINAHSTTTINSLVVDTRDKDGTASDATSSESCIVETIIY